LDKQLGHLLPGTGLSLIPVPGRGRGPRIGLSPGIKGLRGPIVSIIINSSKGARKPINNRPFIPKKLIIVDDKVAKPATYMISDWRGRLAKA
jgi:hypothetical protein